VEPFEREPSAALAAVDLPNTAALESASGDSELRSLPKQLRDVSAILSQALQKDALDFNSSENNPIDEFLVARLFLLSTTLMAHRYTSAVLGTHEINLLYKHRQKLDMTTTEQYQVLRSFLSNNADVQPGWFWFRQMPDDQIGNSLFLLAARDTADDVRVKALTFLGEAGIELPEEMLALLPFDHGEIAVRKATVRYVIAINSESGLEFLEKLPGSDQLLEPLISHERLKFLARSDPTKVLCNLLEKDKPLTEDVHRELGRHLHAIDEKTLLKAIESSHEKTRRFSAAELLRRKSLPLDVALKLTSDSSLSIRALGFQRMAEDGALPDLATVRKALKEEEQKGGFSSLRALAGLGDGIGGEDGPDIDSIIVTFYSTWTTENLLNAVDWFSVDGQLAYRALALHRFNEFSHQLRSDLKGNFDSIREGSVKQYREHLGVEGVERLVAAFSEYDDFIRSQFAKAALQGLAAHAEIVDAGVARTYLNSPDWTLQALALDIISKVGGSQDVEALLDISRKIFGERQQQAASAALKLTATPVETAKVLMSNASPEVAKVAFKWLFSQDCEEVRRIFDSLLYSEDDLSRVRALYYISRRMSHAQSEAFLREYLERETYHYNVVTWLDRLVYAPASLKLTFIGALEAKAL
jgi:hypothetical protein